MSNLGIVPNSSNGGVILKPPVDESLLPKKQCSPRIHHFFTYNNYDSSIVPILIKTFGEFCYMYAFQEETGENGTPHLQGIVSCKRKMRDTEFGLPKAIHWEKPAMVNDCYLYCTKLETRTGEVYTLKYEIPEPIHIINELQDWMQNLLDIHHTIPDKRKVYWVWSREGGKDKSDFTKYMVVKHNALFCCSGKFSDLINIVYNTDMNKTKTVIFDLPRNHGNKISYSAIESIKNGLVCNTKFETGYKVFNAKHVFIFANQPPIEENLSSDRWNIIEI